MTPTEKRQAEMERGRLVSQRASRLALLDRYVAERKLKYSHEIARRLCTIWLANGIVLERKTDGAFPDEVLMAEVELAIATGNAIEYGLTVAPVETPKTEQAKNVMDWSKPELRRW